MTRFAVRLLLLSFFVVGMAAAQPTVVASIHPYFDLARQVAGLAASDSADVQDLIEEDGIVVARLLPPGASPHAFDPRPGDVQLLAGADLVIVNGGLDAFVLELLRGSGSRAEVLVALEAVDAALLPGDEADEPNPHVWLDPLLMIPVVTAIGEQLATIDPQRAERYLGNAQALADELGALDAELQEILAPCRGAPFVPFHDAWPYFAERYGLDLVLELEPFPGREPSPRYLAEAIARIRESGAPAIFAERQLGSRPAEVVAESAGVEVFVLDPLGGGEGVASYQDLLRANARVIAAALCPR